MRLQLFLGYRLSPAEVLENKKLVVVEKGFIIRSYVC